MDCTGRLDRSARGALVALLALACGGSAGDSSPGSALRVLPEALSVAPSESAQFLTSLAGASAPTVVWDIVEPGGGTITATGLYTAPATTGTFHVRASTAAAPSVQGTGTVTVTTAPPPPTTTVPTVGGCPVFTADDAWNTDVTAKAKDATWTSRVQALVGAVNIHPDFGGGGQWGIPVNVVPQIQPLLPISFDYADESDPGPYPFPGASTVKIEGNDPTCAAGTDCHIIAVQQGVCRVYEAWACSTSGSGWRCGSGARFDLTRKSQGQRPAGWTSSDAAGLSILGGLIRYDEVATLKEIRHAIRFTLRCTRAEYVYPASHYAVPGGCAGNTNAPPMGLRMRLAASYDVSRFSANAQVILKAMKKYGLVLADNGGNFFFQAEADPRWSEAMISELKGVPASAFEAIAP
jgi:hypothetical protein